MQAIFGLHLGENLRSGFTFPTLRTRYALLNGSESLHVVQPVEQVLIALRILDDDLGAAIHGQNLWYPGLFEPCQVGFVIAEKISQ